jgi:hypothetical protein
LQLLTQATDSAAKPDTTVPIVAVNLGKWLQEEYCTLDVAT